MRSAKNEMIAHMGSALDWRRRIFQEYEAMGESKVLKVQENFEKEIKKISEVLFSEEIEEKIKSIIRFGLRYDKVFDYKVSVCNFIKLIRNIKISNFTFSEVEYYKSKKFSLVKDDFEFIFDDRHSSDGSMDIADRIISLYRRYRNVKTPHESYRYLLTVVPPLVGNIDIKSITEKIQFDDEFGLSDAYEKYEKERGRIFKNKKNIENTKIVYENCLKNISEKAEEIMKIAIKCKEYNREKYALLAHCNRIDEIERHLEVIDAVLSGKQVDHYILELSNEYNDAISFINHELR